MSLKISLFFLSGLGQSEEVCTFSGVEEGTVDFPGRTEEVEDYRCAIGENNAKFRPDNDSVLIHDSSFIHDSYLFALFKTSKFTTWT